MMGRAGILEAHSLCWFCNRSCREGLRGLLCWVLGKRETAFCATGTYGSKAERPWCDSRKVQLVMGGCCEGAVGSSDPQLRAASGGRQGQEGELGQQGHSKGVGRGEV